MAKQIMVLGLGQFGMGLVRALSKLDTEVIAVDLDATKVQQASGFVAQALCFDATDQDALAQLTPAKRDVCICATGDQSKEVAIICTAILRQLGAKRIIARANDDLHARILSLVGADEVVNPEWDFGARYAARILNKDIIEEMALGSDLIVTEFAAPMQFLGRTLAKLDLRNRYGITVIAVRRARGGIVEQAHADQVIDEGDILVAVASRGAIQKILEQ